MLFLLIFLWPIIFECTKIVYKSYDNKIKISSNITSGSHAIISVIIGMGSYYTINETLITYSSLLSLSYYIWDTYYIILNKIHKEYIYLYHHFVAFFLLSNILNINNSSRYLLFYSLILAEISNFSLYPVYHYTKILDHSDKVNRDFLFNLKLAQMIWYFCIRVIILGYINYYYGSIIPFFLRSFITSIYIMGVYWAMSQIRSLFGEYVVLTSETIKDNKNRDPPKSL